MTNVVIMIIAILIFLTIAEIPYLRRRPRSSAKQSMTNQQYDHYHYYHYIRNH